MSAALYTYVRLATNRRPEAKRHTSFIDDIFLGDKMRSSRTKSGEDQFTQGKIRAAIKAAKGGVAFDRKSIFGYLTKMMETGEIDFARRRARHFIASLEETMQARDVTPQTEPASMNPETVVLGEASLQDWVNRIETTTRPKNGRAEKKGLNVAIILRVAAGESYQEIGDALNMDVDAVRSRLHRIRERMKRANPEIAAQYSR